MICPICYNDRIQHKIIKGYEIDYCCKCDLYFYSGNVNPDEYYAKKENINKANEGKWNSLRWCQKGFIKKYKKENKTILDYGCGKGNFVVSCQENGISSIGYDISPEAVSFLPNNLTCDFSIVEKSQYDIVTMWEVIEHTSDANNIIKQIKKVLKDDGYLYLSTPNREHPAVYDTDIDKYWPPYHITFWNIHSIRKFLEYNGFIIEKVIKRKFSFGNISFEKRTIKIIVEKIKHELFLRGMEFVIVAKKERGK